MSEWLYNNETLVMWVLIASAVSFITTLIAIPIILAKLPKDYFLMSSRNRSLLSQQHPIIRIPLIIAKNLVGVLLLIAGILMLALPGQGILTIIVGLLFMDFPGKYAAERWLIRRRSILRAINWIRRKANKPELVIDFEEDSDQTI